jgi:hypothetical protein
MQVGGSRDGADLTVAEGTSYGQVRHHAAAQVHIAVRGAEQALAAAEASHQQSEPDRLLYLTHVLVEQGKGLLTGGFGFPQMKLNVLASTHPLGYSHRAIVGVDTNQVANQKRAVFGLNACGW